MVDGIQTHIGHLDVEKQKTVTLENGTAVKVDVLERDKTGYLAVNVYVDDLTSFERLEAAKLAIREAAIDRGVF